MIRRITDLPILSSGSDQTGQFLSSYVEISYPEVDDEGRPNSKYVSKCIRCEDFLNQLPTQNYFPNGIYVGTEAVVSGNLAVNAGDLPYSGYSADLRFGQIAFSSQRSMEADCGVSARITAGTSALYKAGTGAVAIGSASPTVGLVELVNTATVDTTISSVSKSVVNMEQLLAQLEAWKAQILDEIGPGGSGTTTVVASVPVGTIIPWAGDSTDSIPDGYLLCDGSEVSKTTYKDLYAVVKNKFGSASSGNFRLPLLTDERYIQGSTSSGTQKAEQLPQHTHTVQDWFLVYNTSGANVVCDPASSASGGKNYASETTRTTAAATGTAYTSNGHVVPKSVTAVYLIAYKTAGTGSSASKMPLLSFVYLDHKISDDEWKIAGSTVDLTKYTTLYEFVNENKSKLPFSSSTGSDEDTWYYTLDGQKLTLPKSNWFIQCGTKFGFNSAGLPAVQGTVSGLQCAEAGSHSHKNNAYGTGSGWLDAGDNVTGSTGGSTGTAGAHTHNITGTVSISGSGLYGKSTTVQPNATKMYVYFYIGPKG